MDPVVSGLREQIVAIDETIVATINRRLELVAELKRYKDQHGISFVDAGREQWLLDHLSAANAGPLSDDGLRAFYAELLALIKRELGA
jgi:chorismate mutase / prephenate dehydratase